MMTEPRFHLVKDNSSPELVDLGDDDLMRLTRTGREDAFAVLIRRHQDFVIGLATRYFADRSLGREVAQDVFLALWAGKEKYQPRGKFVSYLFKVTRNRCHVVARAGKNYQRKLDNLAVQAKAGGLSTDVPLDVLVKAERAREVRANLARLPGKTREVLILRFTHELSLLEIASLTDMPLGTVKSHLFRGLKRMTRFMKEGQA